MLQTIRQIVYLIIFFFCQSVLYGQSENIWKQYEDTSHTNLKDLIYYRPDYVLKISRMRFDITHDYYWKYLEVKALSEIAFYDQALSLAYRIIPEVEKQKNIYVLALLHHEIGQVNYIYGNNEKAKFHYALFKKMVFDIKSYPNCVGALIDEGSIYTHQNQTEKGITLYKEAYQLAKEHGLSDTYLPYICLASIGYANNISGNYKEALTYYKRAYNYFIQTNRIRNIVIIAAGMANCYKHLSDSQQFLYYSEQALYYSKKMDVTDLMCGTYDDLSEYYRNKGDFKEALRMKDSFMLVYKRRLNSQRIISMNELNTYYDLAKKDLKLTENELALSRKNNIIQKKRNEVLFERNKNRLILFSLVLIGLILLLFAVWGRNRRNRREQSIKQRLLELELKALRAQMNPHFIFNCLSSIQHLFLIHSEMEANLYISKFSILLRSVLEHSKRDTISLREEMELLTVYSELENMQFNHPFTFRIVTDLSVDPELIDIPPMLLQPFVENAIRHGFVNKDAPYDLLLSFYDRDGYVHCIIDDNGIGRDAAKTNRRTETSDHQSHGMNITKDRLETLKLRFNLDATMRIIDKKKADGTSDGTRIEISLMI